MALPINYWAVLVGFLFNMILGALWYSPVLFGKIWMKSMNKTKEQLQKENPSKAMLFMAIAAFGLTWMLAYSIKMANVTTAQGGALFAFWIWLGFVATTTLSPYLFESRPIKLYFIYNLYQVIALTCVGALLAVWM